MKNKPLTLEEIRECLKDAPPMPVIENPKFIDGPLHPMLQEFITRISSGGTFTDEELAFMEKQAEMILQSIEDDDLLDEDYES